MTAQRWPYEHMRAVRNAVAPLARGDVSIEVLHERDNESVVVGVYGPGGARQARFLRAQLEEAGLADVSRIVEQLAHDVRA